MMAILAMPRLLHGVPLQLRPDCVGDLGRLHVRVVKLLTHPHHFRQRHSTAKLFYNTIFTTFKCHFCYSLVY